jgi:hypothetical protein
MVTALLCVSISGRTAAFQPAASGLVRKAAAFQPTAYFSRQSKDKQLSRGLALGTRHFSASKDTSQSYDILNQQSALGNKYEPSLFESQIYQWWEQSGCFAPDAKGQGVSDKKPYVLSMPPPNVTGLYF